MLFGLDYFYAVFAAIIYFIVNFIENKRKLDLKRIEEANPELKEILRTAKDNINTKNLITLGLFEQVLSRVKDFASGNLLNYKSAIIKVVIVFSLSILVIMSGFFNFEIVKISIPLDKIKNSVYDFFVELPEIELKEDNKIYGDPKLIEINDPELFLQLTPQVSEITFDNIKEEEELYFSDETFPVEVSVQQDLISEEKKPFESKLAKEYNLKLKEMI